MFQQQCAKQTLSENARAIEVEQITSSLVEQSLEFRPAFL
jgi:hypothetical protein